MNDDPIPDPSAKATGNLRSDSVLAAFLAANSGALKAASSLKAGAEVGIHFTHLEGDWRICKNEAGQLEFEAARAIDPDFSLTIPPNAVTAIAGRGNSDLGELGIAFFEHIVSKEQALRIGVAVHSGLVKLTRRGWLGVLALGGPKVMMWMARKGLRGPGGIAAALGKFKG